MSRDGKTYYFFISQKLLFVFKSVQVFRKINTLPLVAEFSFHVLREYLTVNPMKKNKKHLFMSPWTFRGKIIEDACEKRENLLRTFQVFFAVYVFTLYNFSMSNKSFAKLEVLKI